MRRFLLSFVLVFAFSLFGETKYGIPNGMGRVPLDWSTCTFNEAINETFGIQLNGENVNDSLIVRYSRSARHNPKLINICQQLYSSNSESTPHIALVRILLYCNDGNCYVYNIPYAFLSGEQTISKISLIGTVFQNAFFNISSFSCASKKNSEQTFAQSERAIGLFFSKENILKEIKIHLNAKNSNATKPNVQIQKVIIQIMTKNSMCPACAKFWREEAEFTDTDGNIFISNGNKQFSFFGTMKEKLDINTKIRVKTIYTIEK